MSGHHAQRLRRGPQLKVIRLIAVVVALSCSSVFAVRDPGASMEELKMRRAEVQRKIEFNYQRLKQPDPSSSTKQRLKEEQKHLLQQSAELQRAIKLSEMVQRNESVMYANE